MGSLSSKERTKFRRVDIVEKGPSTKPGKAMRDGEEAVVE